MTQAPAAREVHDVLAGKSGGVNRIIRRFGKPVVDYATALIPDRGEPFDRLVEDILADVIAQCRAAARSDGDEQVFEYVIETALRTVRARYREVLDVEPAPSKATTSYSVNEILQRTGMSQAELSAGISEGRIRAVRAQDELRVKPDGIAGVSERRVNHAYFVSAAERELLCLHYRLGFSPDTIARWAGITPAQVEAMLGKAAVKLAEGIAAKKSGGAAPGQQDDEIRRYIDGRMDGEATAKFERRIIKDKIAQARLDELRSQSDQIKQLFDSDVYDLSAVAVNVRQRNPHHALSLPPVAALWLQVVGIAAVLLIFHSVGTYIAPPVVTVDAVVGEAQVAASRPGRSARSEEAPEGAVLAIGESRRLAVGDTVTTPHNGQVRMVLDASNRVLMAPGTTVRLLEPRTDARQVLALESGEVWGRFASSGYPFAVRFGSDSVFEIASDVGAEFDLVAGQALQARLPDNLETERGRAVAAVFAPGEGGSLVAKAALRSYAGFHFGQPGGEAGIRIGDNIESIAGVQVSAPQDIATALMALGDGESLTLTVRRGNERLAVSATRIELVPLAVVRVFHGALMCGPDGARDTLVNGGQWALFMEGQPPMVGLRGHEDFRVLRIDSRQLFKQHLHWLNTESFPLRSENSLLELDRELREIAAGLEAMRADRITRSGPAELEAFEMIMRRAIDDARARIEAGEPRERGTAANALSDEALVAAEDEIIGAILHWRRQSTAGVHDTLGSAAKTLSATIQRFENDLEERGEEITRAILMHEEIERIAGQIELQDAEIAKLRASDLHDGDGSKRAAIDARVTELEVDVRAGDDATSRANLLRIRLNELDGRIDAERRKLPALQTALADAKAAVADIEARIAANSYTPEKLDAAIKARAAAAEEVTRLEAAHKAAITAADAASDALAKAADTDSRADMALATAEAAAETASVAFEDAVLARTTAQAAEAAALEAMLTAQAELDAIPEENTEAREAAQAKLDEAQAALKTARDELAAAVAGATTAKAALDEADKQLADAQQTAASAKASRQAASDALDQAVAQRDQLDATRAQAVATSAQAVAAVKDLEEARTALALLKTMLTESTTERTQAENNLSAVEGTIETLEADAQPRRDQLAIELATVTKADEAKTAIAELGTQRGRHQAIADDIARREKDRAELEAARKQLEGSNLVLQFDTLKDEYNTLSLRIDALKFLRARGLHEDANFAHEQVSALDAFRDAAEAARLRAVGKLNAACPPYEHAAYAPFAGAEGETLRQGVMLALWRLYYDDGVYTATETDEVCYYVAVRSGDTGRALEALNERWRTYLTRALGREGFERAAQLTPAELRPETPEAKD